MSVPIYAHVFQRPYNGSTYGAATVTRYVLNQNEIGLQEQVACSKNMWERARHKIFNNLGFRSTKNKRIREDNLCYNGALGKVQVLPSFVLMRGEFPVDGRVTFTADQLIELPRRMIPWDASEAEDLFVPDTKLVLRDFMVLLTTKDYSRSDVDGEDGRTYTDYMSLLERINKQPVRAKKETSDLLNSPQKDDLLGYILGSDKYGYERGLHYVEVVCAEPGRGKALMEAYKTHFADRPTLLYANIEVVGFYHKVGFHLGKRCDQALHMDMTNFPRKPPAEKGKLHPKHQEVAELSIQHGLGLRDFYESDQCHRIQKEYSETTDPSKKDEYIKNYLQQFCYQNVAMIYCPSPLKYSMNEEFICKKIR